MEQTQLKALIDAIRANNIEKGWREWNGSPLVTFPEALMLIVSEAAEALEAFRKHGLLDLTAFEEKPEGAGSEMADIFIRLLDTCDAFGIDLESEVSRKMEYNKTRSFRHGGRAL